MRQINQEQYKKALDKARVKFGMSFYGHSGSLRCVIKWDDKELGPKELTNEQLTIVAQLIGKAREPLVDELRRRGLIKVEKAGAAMPSQHTEQEPNDGEQL